jgi:hypothetical protein
VVELLESHGSRIELADERFAGKPSNIAFHGDYGPPRKGRYPNFCITTLECCRLERPSEKR